MPEKAPADLGYGYEDAVFAAADGTVLHGWYIPSQNRAAVIAAHSAGGNRASLLGQAAALAQEGYGVLLLDLRAHGASGGETATFGGVDVEAAARYLATQADVDPNRIGAIGVSLGASVALEAAANTPEIRAVVADGASPVTFKDVPTPGTLAHWLDLPFHWVSFQIWRRAGVTASRPLLQAISDIAPRPILLISGTHSQYEHDVQQALYAAAGEPKTLWEVPEANHTEAWQVRQDEYRSRIIDFFDRSLLDME